MSGQPLQLVPATQARSLWKKKVRPVANQLGFKPGKEIMGGWVRETTPVRVTFWFQINKYGFDKHAGGKFIVEFTAQHHSRQTSLRDRMWMLLDDVSRREVMRINNSVISDLPGPSRATLDALPPHLRNTYLADFKVIDETQSANTDVWFRYATIADVERWADFIALRLPPIVAECERRLEHQPVRTASMGGTLVKYPQDDE